MDCTDYLLAILAAHPTVTALLLQPGTAYDHAALPSHVTVESWGEAYSEARNAEDFVVVRFNV